FEAHTATLAGNVGRGPLQDHRDPQESRGECDKVFGFGLDSGTGNTEQLGQLARMRRGNYQPTRVTRQQIQCTRIDDGRAGFVQNSCRSGQLSSITRGDTGTDHPGLGARIAENNLGTVLQHGSTHHLGPDVTNHSDTRMQCAIDTQ
ncbi:MAG: hypothetical protein RL431_1035, partial [Actinomycetota bacterium]